MIMMMMIVLIMTIHVDPRFKDTMQTPHYQGQFSLSLGKALILSVNSTRFMRTPVNVDNAMDTCLLPNQQIFMERQPRQCGLFIVTVCCNKPFFV